MPLYQISYIQGSEETKQKLEKRARRPLKRGYEPPWFALAAAKKVMHSKTAATHCGSGVVVKEEEPSQSGASQNDAIGLEDDISATIREESGLQRQSQSPITRENVLDFLKNRSQLAGLNSSAAPAARKLPVTRNVAGKEILDLVENKSGQGNPASWQHDETVLDFIRRLPVEDEASADVGPWLWVHARMTRRHWEAQSLKSDVQAFEDEAMGLLAGFKDQRLKLEEQHPEKPPATITRKLGPYKEALENNILHTALKHHVTSGKWMLFPGAKDLAPTWRVVAEATAEGKLGPTSKVGTWEPGNDKKGTLICVYTYDFSDLEDVKRVLLQLIDLGLVGQGGRQIYYKCDGYTYLDLGSNNSYNIRASLYGSKEVLDGEVKLTEDGNIMRVKKNNARSMFDFLQK